MKRHLPYFFIFYTVIYFSGSSTGECLSLSTPLPKPPFHYKLTGPPIPCFSSIYNVATFVKFQMHIEYCNYMGGFLAIKHLYCMFLYFILMNLIIGTLHQFFTKYPIDCSEPAFCTFVKELTESEWFSTLAFSDTCTLLIKSKGINNT